MAIVFLKFFREIYLYSQSYVAAQIGIPLEIYRLIENGQRRPTAKQIAELAKLYCCHPKTIKDAYLQSRKADMYSRAISHNRTENNKYRKMVLELLQENKTLKRTNKKQQRALEKYKEQLQQSTALNKMWGTINRSPIINPLNN